MSSIERELDRVLTLLRNKIRERGFTQLDVQQSLGWGRSYISQLLTKQKSLRVEQVLMILSVIDVEPRKFFDELYHYSQGTEEGRDEDCWRDEGMPVELARSMSELREMVRGILQLLVDKKVVDVDELASVLQRSGGGPRSGELVAD